MKKLFISQPMRGLTDEEILKAREIAINEVSEKLGEEVEVIDSFFENTPDVKTIPLWYLGKSLQLLSEADISYFGKGWQDARGCRIEHTCAREYGVDVILSEFDPHKTIIGQRLDAGLWD